MMDFMDAPCGLFLPFRDSEPVSDVDPADDEDVVLLLDLPGGFCQEAVGGRRDLARFQRAAKGTGQSTGGCGDDVVERGGVLDIGLDAVVFGDGSMDAEADVLIPTGQVGEAERAFLLFDADVGAIDDISHDRASDGLWWIGREKIGGPHAGGKPGPWSGPGHCRAGAPRHSGAWLSMLNEPRDGRSRAASGARRGGVGG